MARRARRQRRSRRPKYNHRDYQTIAVKRCESTGKIIYPSAAVAEGAAKQAYWDHGAEVGAYEDPECGHWHLTSSGQG